MEANKWLICIVMGITLLFSARGNSNYYQKRCIQIVTVILTCFSGFRSWQMGDVFHYCHAYLVSNVPGWKLDLTSHDSIGLQLFFHGAGSLGFSFEVCLFLIAAFTAIALGVLIYRYSPNPYWSYLLYIGMGLYIFTFSGLKQTIAMGFVVFAMLAIIEHRLISFLIFVAIAALFHTPAVVFLIAYPFAHKKVNTTYFLMIITIVAAVFIFRDTIVQKASQIYYVDDISFDAADTLGFKVVFMVLILAFALLLRPLRRYDTLYSQVFNILVLAIIVQTFSVYDNVFTRLADYFFQFIVLFVPLMLQPGWEQIYQYPNHAKEIRCLSARSYHIIGICITAFSLWYYWRYVNASAALLTDFHFFWQVDTPHSLDLLAEYSMGLGGE